MRINQLMNLGRIILLTISMLSIYGCSLLSPVNKPQNTYVLTAIPEYVPTKKRRPINLLVTTPETNPAYNTTQMAYVVKPYEINYFSLNNWVEIPAQMLHPLIVQTLQNTHHFHAIVTSSYFGHYDYLLSTQILKLQQNFLCQDLNYELKLRVQLIKITTNEVVATKQISVFEPIRQATPYGGVIAANRATAKALQEIATFCLKNIR